MKKTLLSVVLFAFIMQSFFVFAQKETKPTPPPKVEIKTLLNEFKIMSFSVRMPNSSDGKHHWKFRKESALDAIAAQSPDVLLLQDVDNEQVSEIESALSSTYELAKGYSKEKTSGSLAPIFYKKSLFNLLEKKTGWVGATGSTPARSYRALEPMLFNMVKLQDKTTRQPFIVYNYILDLNTMLYSSDLIGRYFADIMQSPNRNRVPIIFAGDFKVTGKNQVIKTLSNKVLPEVAIKSLNQSMDEIFAIDNINESLRKKANITGHDLEGNLRTERNNLILFSPGWSCSKQGVINEQFKGMYPSNQFPIVASLKYEKEVIIAPPQKKEAIKAIKVDALKEPVIPTVTPAPIKKITPVLPSDQNEDEENDDEDWQTT